MPSRLSAIFKRKGDSNSESRVVPPTRNNTAASEITPQNAEASTKTQNARGLLNRFQTVRIFQQPQAISTSITPEHLYECKDLMRDKYKLSVEVFAMKKTARANIGIREEKDRRAEAAMKEILRRVRDWDKETTWTEEEHQLVLEIQRRLGVASDSGNAEASMSSFDRVSQWS